MTFFVYISGFGGLGFGGFVCFLLTWLTYGDVCCSEQTIAPLYKAKNGSVNSSTVWGFM